MPTIHVQRETTIRRDFRVQQVCDLFDLQLDAKSRLEIHAPLPDAASDAWTIGLIVGGSGTGKTSVARQWLAGVEGGRLVEPRTIAWPKDKAVVSAFPKALGAKEITATLAAVGFSTPPAWCLPYAAISTGQQMRADLARALLEPAELLGFDEFTSVVDRTVAKAVSVAVAKAVRGGRVPARRFVAVTCHHDVAEWLTPDWILDLDRRELARGSLRRPEIRFAVDRLGRDEGRRLWPSFARHHYLSAALHPAATKYAARLAFPGEPEVTVGFLATLPNAGFRGYRRVHRLVVLPDYQGLGVGLRLLEAVAAEETARGSRRVSIRTSHPALIAALGARRDRWRCVGVERRSWSHQGLSAREGRRIGSGNRGTVAFAWRPAPQTSAA